MLILTRRPGESIFIGNEIEVVILGASGPVTVGISAPRDVEIVRTELIPADQLEEVE